MESVTLAAWIATVCEAMYYAMSTCAVGLEVVGLRVE